MNSTPTTEDRQLWNRFREGDPAAFSDIYETHIQALFRYGTKLLPDDSRVLDCIHDLFVELHLHRNTIGETDNIRLYLFQSLKHKIFRHLKNSRKIATDALDRHPFLLEATFDEQPDDPETTRQKRRLLRRALNQLPSRQKEIIYLRYINDFDLEEITRIMDISYQAVRNTLHKAIETLRRSLSKDDLLLLLICLRKQPTTQQINHP